MARPSTAKRYEAFAREYVVDHNATAAYRRVGFKGAGHVAEVLASRLLRKVEVWRRVGQLEREAAARVGLEVDRVLRESARLALVDIRKLFRPDGQPKAPHELDDDTAAAVVGIEVMETSSGTGKARRLVRTFKYKVLDKNPALDRLFKHKGLFAKDNEQSADAIVRACREWMEAVSGKSRGLPEDPRDLSGEARTRLH